jgi:membrane protein
MPAADPRGRGARNVTDIPARGWKDILWRTWTEITADRVLLIAAGVTFYALLAFVPALTALISIYGFFADPAALSRHMDQLEGLIPGGGLDILREQLQRLTQAGQTRLGLTSATALAIALWSANSGMKSLFEAMNIAYDEEEKRGFVRLTAITMLFTLATLAAAIVLSALVVVLPTVLGLFGFGAAAQWAARLGGFVLMFAFMTAGLAALYRWGPSRRSAQWRWITPGALLATFVTMAASALFTWYVASFGSYNATYGSLGAVFGFMTWLWISAIIVVVGAELNAEAEHQTRRDTTRGRPRPMGQRQAVMADTVGPSRGEAPAETGGRGEAPPPGRSAWGRVAALAALLWLVRRGGRRPDS